MNRQIGRLMLVFTLLFFVLFGFTAYWSVVDAEDLKENALNRRPLLEQQQIPRGLILAADDTRLAINRSIGRNETRRFYREYPEAGLFSHAVGYAFVSRGSAGLEQFYNDVLSGTGGDLRSFVEELTGGPEQGDDLKTTLDPRAQQTAVDALGHPVAWSGGCVAIAVGVVMVTLGGRRAHPLAPGALVAAVAAMLLVAATGWTVPEVGTIPSGLPPLTPDLPWGAAPDLLVPGVVIALVGFAEPASIARRFASSDRSTWDPDRELVGQGLANIGAAVTGGYPVGGSFSRSALNRLSGARTRWSGIFTGIAVLASLPFVGVLSGLPRSALAGIVIASVLTLLDPRPVLELARWSRPQLAVAVTTIVACLLAAPQVQWGLVAGVTLALGLHLWRELRLDVEVWDEHDLLHVRPEGVLYFASAPGMESRILDELAAHPRLVRVEIHLQRLGRIDVTGALALRSICRDLAAAGVPVVLSGVPEHSRRLLSKVLAGEGVDHTHAARNTASPAHPRMRERPSR